MWLHHDINIINRNSISVWYQTSKQQLILHVSLKHAPTDIGLILVINIYLSLSIKKINFNFGTYSVLVITCFQSILIWISYEVEKMEMK
jgi:hypothetical protein